MKNLCITVNFINPVAELRSSLSNAGARKVSVMPAGEGWWKVGYEIKMDDPRVEIEKLIAKAGALPLGLKSTEHGAEFDFRVNDDVDENAVRQKLWAQIKSAWYGVN